MATNQGTRLALNPRDTSGGSRATRRLRRTGQVPGVLYGGEGEPVSFTVDARVLRHALAARGAVLDLEIDGASQPAVLKDAQYHPVRGETMHVDLLRVRLDVAIHATVAVELTGSDEAPGVVNGGVIDQITREVNVEALPNEIPETITFDVSGMEINDTIYLSSLAAPKGVTLLDDLEETVLVTLAPPNVDVEAEEEAEDAIEQETGVVGEGEGDEAAAEGEESADADASSSED
ncbi:MAG: large subunit ribosomal protein [Solirubrobacteraceae bacterium]|jgi:large subunit ribosomal protein L25|nr:large subunit ribosomal protein [Solirubrobacteraceae bacterium]